MTKEKICADCKKWEMGETWGTGRGKTIVECRGWCYKTPWRKPRWNYQSVCGSFDPREQTSLILHGQGYPTEEQLQEIDNEIRNFLNKDNNMEQQEQPKRDKAAEYAEVVGRRFRPTFDSPIDYFEIRGYDAERDMVLTTAHPKQGEPFDDEIEEVYLMAAFENGDYKVVNDKPVDERTFEIMARPYLDMMPPTVTRKQKFCGPCCDRCQHRFGTTSNRDWCCSHYENDKCYRFKLDKQ